MTVALPNLSDKPFIRAAVGLRMHHRHPHPAASPSARENPRRSASLETRLLNVKEDRAFRYLRRAHARASGILRDPVFRLLHAFVSACLVATNRHRESAIAAAGEGITDKAFDRTHQFFDLIRALLQQIKQLLRTLSRKSSYDSLKI